MKNLRKLVAAVVLTFALAMSAFAGEIPTPPCAVPGQIETPPCSVAPSDMDTSGVTSTTTGDTVANSETSLTEIATDVFMNFLSLY